MKAITVQLRKGDTIYATSGDEGPSTPVYTAKRDVLLRIDEFNVGMGRALDLLEGSPDARTVRSATPETTEGE